MAQLLGVSHAMVNNIIHDRGTCRWVANAIARVVGKNTEELWPRYAVARVRTSRRREAKMQA